GELMEGVIRKIDERNVYVELGDKKIDSVMPPTGRVLKAPTREFSICAVIAAPNTGITPLNIAINTMTNIIHGAVSHTSPNM
ncbi:MAG: hypothetical protein IJY04_08450, partial [Clostridia bacterium]|nr:hypothetical protein [Clostridia bacterium]